MTDPNPSLAHIAKDLRPLAVPIESVHLDPANARTGHAVDRIAGSLDQYGQRGAIVANRAQGGKIEKGNGTYQAARQLGWTHIAVVWVEDDPATAAGFAIADNRTGDLSAWDTEALLAAAETAEDNYTGFFEHELQEMLAEIDKTELREAEADKIHAGLGGNRKGVIKAVFYTDDLATFERAIRATGLTNRAEAVQAICKSYLERTSDDADVTGGGK